MNKGFTLLEIVVVISIVAIFSILIITNYHGGGRELSLLRSTHKLAQDLRVAQEMAMSSRKFHELVPEGGYGVYFEKDQNSYILFADCNNNGEYDNSYICPDCSVEPCVESSFTEKVEEIFLEEGINVSEISVFFGGPSLSSISVSFLPPDPTVIIRHNEIDELSAYINLSYNGRERVVSINNIGSIDID